MEKEHSYLDKKNQQSEEGMSFLSMLVVFFLLLGLVAIIRTYGAEFMKG